MEKTMKRCIILRGIPGSGKSTKARELAGSTGKIHSTDDYFEVDGEYRFNPKMLGRNHELNFKAFKVSLALGIDPVVVDNTNIRLWEFQKYEAAAAEAGYQVEIVKVPHVDPKLAAERNTHGVPEHAIRRMLARWED